MQKLIIFLPIFLPILLLSCGTVAPKEGFRVTTYKAGGEVAAQYEVKDYDADGNNGIYIMVGGEKKRVAGSYKIERFVK